MSATARISVIVCTLGRVRELARCLEPLQGVGADTVVVDQSRDGAAAGVAATATYVRAEDEGVSRARNRGAGVASGEILAFTDDDCVPAADWVDVLARTYDASDVDGVTGRVLPLADGVDGVPVSSRTSTVRRRFDGAGTLPWEIGTGGNLSLRRTAFARIGGFDETLGPGTAGRAAEDVDLLYRAVRAGCTIVYEPAAVVYHERKSRRARLAGRFDYGYGMGAFIAGHRGRGDGEAAGLRRGYARVLAGSALAGARRGNGWPLVDGVLTAAGIVAASTPQRRR